ncbi:MAG: hypothetical protein LBS50_08210 [Prevotellaceae bacterium]|jgi:hypothetical protein|nr:hypothetical protein [Prevotellaceae bacterium]
MGNFQKIGDIDNSQIKDIVSGNKTTKNEILKENFDVENLIKRIEKLENRTIPKWVYWVWIISILGLLFSLVSILFLNHGNNILITIATTLILSFVGILATFIVISNYAQVKEIEIKFKVENEKLEKRIKIQELNNQENERKIKENQGLSMYNIAEALLGLRSYDGAIRAYIHSLGAFYNVNQNYADESFNKIEYFATKIKNRQIRSSKINNLDYIQMLYSINIKDPRICKIADLLLHKNE